jgi:transposase
VASTLDTLSARDMIEALIAGERDPHRLAELARGKMKAKRSELITALDGRFDEHHGELARMLLGQIDALSAQIDTLSARIEELIAAADDDAARGIDHPDNDLGPGAEHNRPALKPYAAVNNARLWTVSRFIAQAPARSKTPMIWSSTTKLS